MFFPNDGTLTFIAYNGVTMLVPMDKTPTIGDGDEEGSYIVLMCIGCPNLKWDKSINPIQGSSIVASATNTPQPLEVSHNCNLIVGCAYYEQRFAEFPGISVISCNSKCNENPHYKAYKYSTDKDGAVRCHLLDADALNSYTPLSDDINSCSRYIIHDIGCP
jgi:hypothetical protein